MRLVRDLDRWRCRHGRVTEVDFKAVAKTTVALVALYQGSRWAPLQSLELSRPRDNQGRDADILRQRRHTRFAGLDQNHVILGY